jgi:hypothetical protein
MFEGETKAQICEANSSFGPREFSKGCRELE